MSEDQTENLSLRVATKEQLDEAIELLQKIASLLEDIKGEVESIARRR